VCVFKVCVCLHTANDPKFAEPLMLAEAPVKMRVPRRSARIAGNTACAQSSAPYGPTFQSASNLQGSRSAIVTGGNGRLEGL
jgi:hypothetical protein